jgi:IS5 family transposase
MTLPTTPFAAVPMIFLVAGDSDLLLFLQEAHDLLVGCPGLIERAEADLDAHGCRKKALRVADAAWLAERTAPLPGYTSDPAVVDPTRLRLAQGRPRTPAYVVLIAVLLRGYFGAGFKSCDAATMMQESITLCVFFANLGLTMPGRSTLTELVNAIGNETRLRLLDAQVARVLGLGWDDFSVMLQDSTHVEGNTEWPTDSRLLVALVSRVLRVGASLARVHLPAFDSFKVRQHLAVMSKLDRTIDMSRGTREGTRTRRQRYKSLLWRARRACRLLNDAVTQVEVTLTSLDVLPSRRAMAERAVQRLRADVDALTPVIANCEARVIQERKVPMAEKKLSLSDPDVGFITKGQRVPVIGYKPQIARSGAGFVTGLRLPKGNAADSEQLVPMVDEVVRRTTVVPRILSVDDGYASAANMAAMKARDIDVISINGSKGRALTARADWKSDAYVLARDQRSAIESLMFTLKQGFDFGEVARRGLVAAHGELLEKVLAYNLCHLARMRLAKEAAAKSDDAPALAYAA